MGMLHCDGTKTLSGMLREVAIAVTISGLSRFLVSPAWSVTVLDQVRYQQFALQTGPIVAQIHRQQKAHHVRRRGRPTQTVVTGYLIMDDSTHTKRYYAKIASGLGRHYSSIEKKPVKGHNLFQAVYVMADHQFPLTPRMYCQKAVCEQLEMPFQSKVDLSIEIVKGFEPLADTHTHVLVDSWYLNKKLWKATKTRGWDITGGLKSNRRVRIVDCQGVVSWPTIREYAASLSSEDFQAVNWPIQSGEQVVYAHLLRTLVKRLGACQVLVVRDQQANPASTTRFFATSRLKDTLEQVVTSAAQRWTVETLFADFKELMGSDQYQLHSAQAIERFWALAFCLYQFLDSLRHRLERLENRHISLGETRAWLIDRHKTQQLDWICFQAAHGAKSSSISQCLRPALSFSFSNC
jgi:Transposase DDE domain